MLARSLLIGLSVLLGGSVLYAERIVSLGGAATEIVFALGAGDAVVGRDQSSVYPPAALRLPEVGYVRTISAEGVLALEPTLVVATSDLGPQQARAQLYGSGVELLEVEAPTSLDSLRQAITDIAAKLNRKAEGEALIKHLNDAVVSLEELPQRPSVVFYMKTPGGGASMAAGKGTKASALIDLAGGHNAVNTHHGYKHLSREALIALNPDVVILAVSEGPGYDAHAASKLALQPGWSTLSAVQEGHLYTVPLGRTLGFGPRLGDVLVEINGLLKGAVE